MEEQKQLILALRMPVADLQNQMRALHFTRGLIKVLDTGQLFHLYLLIAITYHYSLHDPNKLMV